MHWKEHLKEYFSFSRKERTGIITLVFLIGITMFLPVFFHGAAGDFPSLQDTSWIASLRKLERKQAGQQHDSFRGYQPGQNARLYEYDRTETASGPRLFYFDPNTLPERGWKDLGIRERTIQTILKYLDKGGRFHQPEDLQRIYGLRADEYNRLLPFVKIERTVPPLEKSPSYPQSFPKQKTISPAILDINTADTSAFIALPGIGSKLAGRIVNFREKLGGFYSIDQLKETYGLHDSTFEKIKLRLQLNTPISRRINVNIATPEELKAHPYLKYDIVRPLIAYRNEHGPFLALEELKKIPAVTEEVYEKIKPYLTLE
jgi:competence ComEA-like helix-hairpin-helix protein